MINTGENSSERDRRGLGCTNQSQSISGNSVNSNSNRHHTKAMATRILSDTCSCQPAASQNRDEKVLTKQLDISAVLGIACPCSSKKV
jgi:hypothetical protein